MTHHTLISALLRHAKRGLSGFARGDRGAISVETVLILPLLGWALVATVAFTDAFRHQSTLLRSVYTVTDLVTKSSEVRPSDIDGFYTFLRRINETSMPIRMRISLIGWDSDEEQLRVVWSNADHAGSFGALDDAALNAAIASQVPRITQGETLVLTEAWLQYTPPFQVGLSARTMSELAIMRPRFAPGIRYDDPNAPPPPTAWCEFIVDGCGM